MFGLLEIISGWVLDVISRSGYLGVFVLSVLESAAIPVPSEIIVPFSGFLASQGKFDFWILVFGVSFANLAGGTAIYLVSRFLGRALFEKFGRYILISERELDQAERLFEKHGFKFVFIGRILPVIRTFISIPAGVAKMNFCKFSFYTYFGSLPWNFALALIGFKAGENWDSVLPYFHKFDFVIIGLGLVFAVWYVYRHIKERQIVNE